MIQFIDNHRLYRLPQIIGNKEKGIQALIPVSRSTILNWVKAKTFPEPVKLSPGVVAWRGEDLLKWMAGCSKGALL